MTSAHSAASHRVACWTTNVHHALLQASTNCLCHPPHPPYPGWAARVTHSPPCNGTTQAWIYLQPL